MMQLMRNEWVQTVGLVVGAVGAVVLTSVLVYEGISTKLDPTNSNYVSCSQEGVVHHFSRRGHTYCTKR